MNMTKNIWPFSKDPHVQFEALVKPHLKRLYNLAYRLTGQRDSAEDLVQDVLLKAYPLLDEMKDIEQLAPWLSKILYRQFVDQYRRIKRSPVDFTDDEQSLYDSHGTASVDPADIMNTALTQTILIKALDTLNEEQRVLVLLHDTEGYTLQEISHMLDTPVGTLKSRLSRARAKLREILQDMEPNSQQMRVIRDKG